MSIQNPSTESDEPADVVEASDDDSPKSESSVPLTKARQKAIDAKTRKSKARLGRPDSLNPAWLVPTMLSLLVGGLVWIVVFYVASGLLPYNIPIPAFGQWNLAVGFGLILGGGILSTRYR